MRVEFNYTIDDMVDVQMRVMKNSRTVRAWRWHELVLASLMSGIFLFAVISEGITGRLIMGSIGLVLGALSYAALHEWTIKRRLRKWCEENAGSARDFTCVVELNESGIHTQSNETQMILDWKNLKEIRDTSDSVDLYFERGGLLVTRNRAFTSAEERQRFIGLAKEYSEKVPGSGAVSDSK